MVQLCTEFKLAIGTTFSHQDTHKATWIHPRSKHGHILDYLIIRKRDLQDVCTVRVMRGADCGTDHRLIRGKMNLCIMRKNRSKGVNLPKRIDVSRLKETEVRDNLQRALRENLMDHGKSSSLTFTTSVSRSSDSGK